MPLLLRSEKGSPLTNDEVDGNFVFVDNKATAAGTAAATADAKAVDAQADADSALAIANAAIPLTQKGAVSGVAPLGGDSKVPAAYLPSYVDDVVEYANLAAFPATGESGKIYVALDTGKIYRWSGSAYAEISPSPGSTDAVPEGATNKYFTVARVLATFLTGLSVATGGPIVDTDTVLAAFGKLQNQMNLKANLSGATFTGTINEAPIATMASAATVNIGAAVANTINITGTTTITAFDAIAAGATRSLMFAGSLTLTHNATSLILPSGASIATAAGDVAEFVSLGSGNWRCTGYSKADGQAQNALGSGQTWQNVKASRALGVTYTNSTGKPIQVQVTTFASGGDLATATVGGVEVSKITTPASSATLNSFVVPPGATYKVDQGGTSPTIFTWTELR